MQRGKGESENLEEAELRLRRVMQMQSEASEQLKFSQAQYDNVVRLLQTLRNQHNQLKKSFLFNKVNHFQSTSTRMNNLVTAANERKNSLPTETKAISKPSACSQSKHLFQIFSRKEQEEEEQQIQQIEQKLNTIYDKIGKCIEEELLSQKVMGRIKKESRRAAKVKTIQLLEREISKYKGWLQDSKAKLTSDLSEKEVEQKVMHNLGSMKLLMNKKIISNDYIYDQFGEEAKEIHRLVESLDSFKTAMQGKALQYSKAVQQCLTQTHHNRNVQPIKITKIEASSLFSSIDIIACFQQGESLMQQIQQYDTSLTLRCQALQAVAQGWQKSNRR